MRSAIRFRSSLVAAFLLAVPAMAGAESASNIIVVDNSDGYGVDACLATGGACGQAMADAWCRVHDFQRAVSFGKVSTDAITASVGPTPVRTACYGSACAETVAITCSK